MDPSNFSTITYTINITNYSSELDTNISIFDEVNQDSRSINYPDTIWLMTCTALVFLMFPGLGLYHSGYVKRSSSLTVFMSILLPLCVITIQWFLYGYSLVYSSTGSKIIGNFDNAFLINVDDTPNPMLRSVPSNVFMIYKGLFAALTPCFLFGAIAERATLSSFVILSFFWSTFVYDFIAYMTWNQNGWLNKLGVLDFAGAGPVHISSGCSALAFALAVGPRTNSDFKNTKPVNLKEIFVGTCLLWLGWLGFNGGSGGAINARSINAVVVSNLAACTGAITWMLIDMAFKRSKKVSLNALCTGAISSLVSITPACGFVKPHFAILIGFITSIACFFGTYLKRVTKYKFDDTANVFAIHGIGGMIGSIMTGILAESSVVTMSGNDSDSAILGGMINGHHMQIVYQLLAIAFTAVWSFLLTFALVKLIEFIPIFRISLDENALQIGSDFVELGELAYGVELIRKNEDSGEEIVASSSNYLVKGNDKVHTKMESFSTKI